MYTIPPLTLVHPEGFEPSYPVRGAVLQTAAFNQTRPQMLETPVGIEPTITVLQTDALPLGDGVWHTCRELNPRFQVWNLVDHRWLRCWLSD